MSCGSIPQLIHTLLRLPFRPKVCRIDGVELPLMRAETPIKMDGHLEWLSAQTIFPKIYWENPQEKTRVTAIGQVFELNDIPIIEGNLRLFGGNNFMSQKHGGWKNFPLRKYILPLVEVEDRGGCSVLRVNRLSEHTTTFDIQYRASLSIHLQPISRLDDPTYPVWHHHLKEILDLISHNVCSKVVLSRRTAFEFERPPNPYAVLRHLKRGSPSTPLFSFQFEKGEAFIGASPETLYKREDREIKSIAMAGTRPRGNSIAEDIRLFQELLSDKKERHELNIVKNHIYHTLSPLCHSLYIENHGPIRTATVQHPCYLLKGSLKNAISDRDLIQMLHPTPAIGGSPKEKAIEEIAKRENFDRGWYAAPVGWITERHSHHVVAIRSALIQKSRMLLFAGAGIVRGSSPSSEWSELEQKIRHYFWWKRGRIRR